MPAISKTAEPSLGVATQRPASPSRHRAPAARRVVARGVRCPACGTPLPHPSWPEPEPEPVAITLYCDNPGCPVTALTAYEA